MTTVESTVAIIGAGAFGLSTSLHLKRRGYKNVTVYDYQPYDQNHYDPTNGCDAASADVNKIYRCSYGDWKEYQDLAMKGRPIWEEWNRTISNTPADLLPPGLTPSDQPFVNGGFIRQNLLGELHEYDYQSLEELAKVGLREHVYIKGDVADLARLKQKAKQQPEQYWFTKLHALDHAENGRLSGFLDTFAGYTRADKACIFAHHLCEQAGVRFVLGPKSGKVQDLIVDGSGASRRVKGFATVDGKRHLADVVLVCCGGWTPSLIPETKGLLETTAGSVVTIQLPSDRPDLWDKYSPEKFPTWSHGMVEGTSPEYGGFYGFPRTPQGVMKIGYRGRKWTNYQTHPKTGERISVPTTKYTEVKATNLPKKALKQMKRAIEELFPDLTAVGITDTRMCWYTDSLDDSFVIDYVPGYNDTLFVASGGSGHGFKFLPVLGEHIANQLERRPDQFTPLWRWRSVAPGAPANGLEEGEASGRNLATLEIGEAKDLLWQEQTSKIYGVIEAVRARL